MLNGGRSRPAPPSRLLPQAAPWLLLQWPTSFVATYRCLQADDDVVELTAADVEALDSDRELADEDDLSAAFRRFRRRLAACGMSAAEWKRVCCRAW